MYNLTNIPDLDKTIFTMLDINTLGNYGISSKNNYEVTGKIWQVRLREAGIILYHEYEYVNYKELYKMYDYINYILDNHITNLLSNCPTFYINRNILTDYYIKLMIFLDINIDKYTERQNQINTFDYNNMKDKVAYINVCYKKYYYCILLYESITTRKCFSNLTYNQVLNFMFNASLDGVIIEITSE